MSRSARVRKCCAFECLLILVPVAFGQQTPSRVPFGQADADLSSVSGTVVDIQGSGVGIDRGILVGAVVILLRRVILRVWIASSQQVRASLHGSCVRC